MDAQLEILENYPNLQHVDLENTLVKGSLDVFEKTPLLEVANLAGTRGQIVGNISVFRYTENLRVLRLNATSVEGDVAVFQKTPRLEELGLKNASHVSGELPKGIEAAKESLRKLTITHSEMVGMFRRGQFKDLQELHLEGVPWFWIHFNAFDGAKHLDKLILKDTGMLGSLSVLPASLVELYLHPLNPEHVVGTIDVLSDFPSLEVLSLPKTDVKGKLQSLKNHTLRVLNLADTQVEGEVEGLQVSKMQIINLQGTPVRGDLRVFKEANGLKELHVGATNIGGDIQVFKNMPELRELNISETLAGGDIQVFQHNPELQLVHAWLTRVHGDIGIFAKAKKVKYLAFSGTAVHGDIGALRDASGLVKVGFTETRVWGDIRAFESATRLREVWLSGTNTSGDIRAFVNSSHLELVFLSKTSVFGSIQAFAEARQLKKLSLGSTKVEGNIDVFRRMQRLEVLTLDHTHVLGNFASFYKMVRLKILGLGWCNITGTLYKVAASLQALMILRLSKTFVTGELSNVASQRLQEFHAAATAITGDIERLMWLPSIRVVDLSGTNVSGRITTQWVGQVQKLHSLDLSETRLWSQQIFTFFWTLACTSHMYSCSFLLDSSLLDGNES